MTDSQPRRYAVCGLSNRGLASFVLPLLGHTVRAVDGPLGYGAASDDLSAAGRVAAIVDPDERRVAEFNRLLGELGSPAIPYFRPGELDRMLTTVAPDAVIVTSPDHTHADYIIAALDRDIDVISEKPMVTTAAAARDVLAAERRSRAGVRVAHNFRYLAPHQRIKQLIVGGAVGRVTRVTMDYHVDIRHGASYFYRWNRRRALSGGLSVHKCCHHFDLVNWWVGQVPREIFGYGALNYYGPDSPHNPARRDGVDYSVSQLKERDPYFLAQRQAGLFPEDDDRQAREGLFGLRYPAQYPPERPLYLYDDEIDIEDTYSAVVSYEGGAGLAYSVDFSSAWEGYRLGISGTHGSLEMLHGRAVDGTPLPGTDEITHYPLFGAPEVIPVPTGPGGHGGADPLMRRDLFLGPGEESRAVGLAADSIEAAHAVALGEGLWRSVTERRPVDVAALLA